MGGLITNVDSLLGYARCYLCGGKTPGGKQVLKPETIAEMFTPQAAMSEQDRTSRGISWMRQDLDEGFIVGHGGGTKGQLTQLSLLPEHDFALAIFTNSTSGGKLISQVHKFLLKTYLGLTIEQPHPIDSTPAELRLYTGTALRPGVKIHLEMLGEHLVGLSESTVGFPTENEPPPPPEQPFRLGRCAADRLIILDGDGKDTPVDVFRNDQGQITHLRASRMYRFVPAAAA
jgi:CubicO group peptidase (beta-lactamase class C family)